MGVQTRLSKTEKMAHARLALGIFAVLLVFTSSAQASVLSAQQVGDCAKGECFVELDTQNGNLICLSNIDADGNLIGEKLCQALGKSKRAAASAVNKRWSHWDALIHPI